MHVATKFVQPKSAFLPKHEDVVAIWENLVRLRTHNIWNINLMGAVSGDEVEICNGVQSEDEFPRYIRSPVSDFQIIPIGITRHPGNPIGVASFGNGVILYGDLENSFYEVMSLLLIQLLEKSSKLFESLDAKARDYGSNILPYGDRQLYLAA